VKGENANGKTTLLYSVSAICQLPISYSHFCLSYMPIANKLFPLLSQLYANCQ